jgi:hypothetical protein
MLGFLKGAFEIAEAESDDEAVTAESQRVRAEIEKSLRLVPKLMKVVEAARDLAESAESCKRKYGITEDDDGGLIFNVRMLNTYLVELDDANPEGAQEIADRLGYETPSEGQQRLNQDRNIEDLGK